MGCLGCEDPGKALENPAVAGRYLQTSQALLQENVYDSIVCARGRSMLFISSAVVPS